MIEPWSWVITLFFVALAYSVLLTYESRPKRPADDTCVNHPSVAQCACRNNLPKGKL